MTRPRIRSIGYAALLALPSVSVPLGVSAAKPASLASELPCGGSVVVESGDTLADIASLCGVAVEDILAVNTGLTDANDIRVDQRLEIPAAIPAAGHSSADLEEILAPIALYPDALLAEILPAATYPLEIVQADRWAKTNSDADTVESEDWAPSVKALVRYPEVLATLSNDLDWTISIGDAFLEQPDEVFATIQTLRARAEAAGNLKSDEHHLVVEEPVETVEVVEPVVERETVIRIVPAYSEIYVPYYDHRVYRPYHEPLFHYSSGYAIGSWLTHYLDWHHYNVHVYPFSYRHLDYYTAPHLRLHSFAHRWSHWHHQPFHRRGYRYRAPPRVRIAEGQRHGSNAAVRTPVANHVARNHNDRRQRNRVVNSLGGDRRVANRSRAGRTAIRGNTRRDTAGRVIRDNRGNVRPGSRSEPRLTRNQTLSELRGGEPASRFRGGVRTARGEQRAAQGRRDGQVATTPRSGGRRIVGGAGDDAARRVGGAGTATTTTNRGASGRIAGRPRTIDRAPRVRRQTGARSPGQAAARQGARSVSRAAPRQVERNAPRARREISAPRSEGSRGSNRRANDSARNSDAPRESRSTRARSPDRQRSSQRATRSRRR